jgi:hypothetical protein
MLYSEITVGVQTRCQRQIWQHCRIIYLLRGTDSLKTWWSGAELSADSSRTFITDFTLQPTFSQMKPIQTMSLCRKSGHRHRIPHCTDHCRMPRELDDRETKFPFLVRTRTVHTSSKSHRTPCPMNYGSTFPEVKRPDPWADLHLVPKVKNSWSFSCTSPYFFMAWCLI